METAAVVEGLVKEYPGGRAVDGLDLEVRTGEILALLGPNGAGKTTTVEILEGFRRRTAGRVEVLGVDPEHAGASWRERVGVVLQEASFPRTLTPREILRSTALAYRSARDVSELLDAVGLADAAGRRVSALSGGQQRRLDVAAGIVGRPELLFLDEPTTGFDPAARRDFWHMIRGLATDGTTILLTTHYLDEAQALADRVAVVAAGRLVALDTPDRLGGRDRRVADVRWEDETGVRHLRTDEPARAIAELVARHGEPRGLTVSRPTLEDAYLWLVGEPAAAAPTSELEVVG